MYDLQPGRILRVVDLDNRVRGDTDEVCHVAEMLLTAYRHRATRYGRDADGEITEPADWRDECGLDLENSDRFVPSVPCLGGVACFAGDDLDSIVALQWRNDEAGIQGNTVPVGVRGAVVAVVVQDIACD